MRKNKWILLTIICVPLWLLSTSGSLLAVEETGGIGLKVGQLYDYITTDEDKRGSLVVLDVFNGSPAHLGGIQKGDIILQIGEATTRRRDFNDILHNLLRGPSFTEIKLVIWRPSRQEKIELILQRMMMVY
ncbi:MAG: PDZ domain-containing protein [Deltaproteobacteria bacterium]|nr:PDZ domain-containing protein [Deltaproteobacteria bacterium]